MWLSDVERVDTADGYRLQATVNSQLLPRPFRLEYECQSPLGECIDPNNGNVFCMALLLPCMALGEDLELSAPISPALYARLTRMQMIYQSFDSTLSVIAVRAPVQEARPAAANEVGLFYSGGVDSTYTLLRYETAHPLNREPFTQLIVISGFDVRINHDLKRPVAARRLDNARRIGQRLGKGVVPVSTNLKELTESLHLDWGDLAYGAVLASAGLLLEARFKSIAISAALTYAEQIPEGAHPLLVPLWSTEHLEFVHEGWELTRLEKTKYLATSALALETLRVCSDENSLDFNCGRCSKCLRAMMSLYLAGTLDKSSTFPHKLDIDSIRRASMGSALLIMRYEEYASALGSSPEHEELRCALQTAIDRERPFAGLVHRAVRQILRLVPVRELLILVDRGLIRGALGAARAVVPFLEKDGAYYGPPADDETALREFDRMRARGAKYIAFFATEFWWLESYPRFASFLRSEFPCVWEDDSVVIFRLSGCPAAQG